MGKTRFRIAKQEDCSQLATWLVDISQAPEHHCLHTWSGQSPRDLEQQLLGYWEDSELCYVVAARSGQLVGAMGSEFDERLARGWLHGPHVASRDWDELAGGLFHQLLAELPASIRRVDAYLNVENLRGRQFYARHGFTERRNLNHDFWLTIDQRVASGDTGCIPLDRPHQASFMSLYAKEFPEAYYSAQRIIDMIGHSHQVMVLAEGEEVTGFAVVNVEGDRSTGELQFFAVQDHRRGQGLGRRLLLSAIDWLLDEARVGRIILNVGEDLVHARGLYESVGFRLQFTGIGLERDLAKGLR